MTWQDFGWACISSFFFAFVVAPLVLAFFEGKNDAR